MYFSVKRHLFFPSTVRGQLLTHSVSIMNISVCSKCKLRDYSMKDTGSEVK